MPWREHARIWFESAVAEPSRARFPVIEIDGAVVACAVGTVEIGIPNPHSPHGRAVRLANVVTRPEHRRKGYGTALVQDVVDWARRIRADRIDLSATPAGLAVYARAGFSVASAPRLKLML